MALTDNKLTPKQELFCQHYTGEAKGNASEAARLAGYAGSCVGTMGDKLVHNGAVQARIEALRSPSDSLLTRTREQALGKLWDALEAIKPSDYRGISAITDQLAKYGGWHSPIKYEDSSQARDLTESIKVKQLESHIEQLLIQIKQLKSIIEVVEHEGSTNRAVQTQPELRDQRVTV